MLSPSWYVYFTSCLECILPLNLRQPSALILNSFLFWFRIQTLTSVPFPGTCANMPALTALENIPALALKDMSSREPEHVKVLGLCSSLGVNYDYLSNLYAHFGSVSKLDMSALEEIYNGIWARYSQPGCHGKNVKARGAHKQGVSVSAPEKEIYVYGVFLFFFHMRNSVIFSSPTG